MLVVVSNRRHKDMLRSWPLVVLVCGKPPAVYSMMFGKWALLLVSLLCAEVNGGDIVSLSHHNEVVTSNASFGADIKDISSLPGCAHWALQLSSEFKKKSFSDSFRVIFIQGIEGSGHHMFKSFVIHVNNMGQHFFTLPNAEDRFWKMHVLQIKKPLSKFLKIGQLGVEVLRKLEKSYKASDSSPATHFIHPLLSYPAFWGKCKIYRYPDMRIFAKIFEDAGIDFRIVTLLRDPVKTISSNIRRGFHKQFYQYEKGAMRYYTSILKDMALQTEQLDPKFYHCFDFDSHTIPDSLGKFLNFKGDIQKAFDDIKIASKEKSASVNAKAVAAGQKRWEKFLGSPSEKAEFDEYVREWNKLKDRCKRNKAISGYDM